MKKLFTILSLTLLFTSVSFAASKSLVYEKEFALDSISSIKTNLASEDLFIKPSKNTLFYVEIYCNKNIYPTVSLRDNQLLLETPNHVSLRNYNCSVHVYIPENTQMDSILLRGSSCDISIGELYSQSIKIVTSSGEISANYLCAESIDITASSGDIFAEEIDSDTCYIKASSGDILINDLDTNEASITSSSGSVELSKCDCEFLECKSTSGDVDVSNIISNELNISTTSGTITVGLDYIPSYASEITTTSGCVYLYVPQDQGFDLVFETTSGSFVDKIEDRKFSPRGEFKDGYYDGGTEIFVETTSGSFVLDY